MIFGLCSKSKYSRGVSVSITRSSHLNFRLEVSTGSGKFEIRKFQVQNSSTQVVACITNPNQAWRLLNEATEQACYRGAALNLVICRSFVSANMSSEETTHLLSKLNHAAENTCRENGIELTINTFDCGPKETTMVEGLVKDPKTALLILTDVLPKSVLARWLPRKMETLARRLSCSVMLLR